MKVAFSGIYDVRFPYETSNKEIDKKYNDIKQYVQKHYNYDVFDISLKDSFNVQKTDKKLADKGIRISTSVDNPWILFDIFQHMDENLGQQFIDNSKVELVLDKIA